MKPSGHCHQYAAGALGKYYNNKDFTNLKFSRLDPVVDFNWGSHSPDSNIGSNTFSVRWTGQINIATAGNYTFYLDADDGQRLWIDGQLLIDRWYDHAHQEFSQGVYLSAGPHDLRIDFYENGCQAVCKFYWAGPGISKQIVPQTVLFPAVQ